MNKYALITGASSGIGLELAKVFAKNGFDIIITARRSKQLEDLARLIREDNKREVHIITEDLTLKNAPGNIHAYCRKNQLNVEVLVNNAGYGCNRDFHAISLEELDDFFEVLLVSLVKLTRLFIPDMLKNRTGKILQVSSIAGILPSGSSLGIYYNAKRFVNEFTISLNSAYRNKGVSVTALCPGITETEFFVRAGYEQNLFDKLSKLVMSAADVAEQGYNALMKQKEIYVVKGRFYQLIVFLSKITSRKVLTRLVDFFTSRSDSL